MSTPFPTQILAYKSPHAYRACSVGLCSGWQLHSFQVSPNIVAGKNPCWGGIGFPIFLPNSIIVTALTHEVGDWGSMPPSPKYSINLHLLLPWVRYYPDPLQASSWSWFPGQPREGIFSAGRTKPSRRYVFQWEGVEPIFELRLLLFHCSPLSTMTIKCRVEWVSTLL